jgi:hypothetical protein
LCGSILDLSKKNWFLQRRSAAAESKSGKTTPPTPKGGRPSKPGAAKPANGTPPQAPRAADRSPGSADKPPSGDRRTPKVFARLSTPPAEVRVSFYSSSVSLDLCLVPFGVLLGCD